MADKKTSRELGPQDVRAALGAVSTARKVGAAAGAWVKREMPNIHKATRAIGRSLKQKLVEPVVDPIHRGVAKATHAFVDAVEPIAEAHLKKTAPKRFKEDFKAAARNPPRINRNITTAVRRAGDGAPTKGADDLVKVQFKGLPSSPPRDPKPNSPGRKR